MAKQSAIDKRILELMAEIKEREIAIDVLKSVQAPRKATAAKRPRLKKVVAPSEAAS